MKRLDPQTGTPYEAPGHIGMECRQLTPVADLPRLGLDIRRLRYGPQGLTEPARSDRSKLYVCLSGSLLLTVDGRTETLLPGNAVLVEPGEERSLSVATADGAEALLVMPA